jgi:hypothetical protein
VRQYKNNILTLPSTILGGIGGACGRSMIGTVCVGGMVLPRSCMAGCIASGCKCGGRSCRIPVG